MGDLDIFTRDYLYNLVRDGAKLSEQQCNALHALRDTMKSATEAYGSLHKKLLLHVQTNEQFTQKVFELLSSIDNNIEKKNNQIRRLILVIVLLSGSVAILLGFPGAEAALITIISKILVLI